MSLKNAPRASPNRCQHPFATSPPQISPIPAEKASKQTQDLAQIPLTLNCLPSILTLQKARSYHTPYKGKFLSDPQEIPCIFG